MLGVRDECVMSRAFILNQKRRTFSVDVAKGGDVPKMAQADILLGVASVCKLLSSGCFSQLHDQANVLV